MVIEEIAANLYRLEVALPAGRTEATNCYIIKGPERNLIVDPGHDHEACLTAVLSALEQLGVELDRTDFFVTHSHGDHCGLLWKLVREESVVFASRRDAEIMNGIRPSSMLENFSQFIEASGFPEKDMMKILPPVLYRSTVRKPLNFKVVDEGTYLHCGNYNFICIHTPGHSDGHMCLYDPNSKLLISGDHILETTGPSVPGRLNRCNPLERYLESLNKIKPLAVEKVLPGHRNVFSQCQERIAELEANIETRSREILSILSEGGKNAYETASQVTWNIGDDTWESLPVFHQFLATQKACAYLKHLEDNEKIKKEMHEGAWVFYAAGTVKAI